MAPIAVDSDPDTVVKTSEWIGRTCRRLIGWREQEAKQIFLSGAQGGTSP